MEGACCNDRAGHSLRKLDSEHVSAKDQRRAYTSHMFMHDVHESGDTREFRVSRGSRTLCAYTRVFLAYKFGSYLSS